METKECPSCAMEIDVKSKACPICGYEFSGYSTTVKLIAVLLAILFIVSFLIAVL